MTLKKPLDMIAEWRKGCAIAGPLRNTDPVECPECTKALIDNLEKSIERYMFVPGFQTCDTCNFSLSSVNLHAGSGTLSARDSQDNCPNCNTPMRRVEERDLRESNYEDLCNLTLEHKRALDLLYQSTRTVDRSKRHEINDFLDKVKYVKRDEVLYADDEDSSYTEH